MAGPGTAELPVTAVCRLDSQPESVRTARDFTRLTLAGWGLDELVDDVRLVVSELVTNALRHAALSAVTPPSARPIRLTLLRRGGHVLCAVTDTGKEPPVSRTPGCAVEGGRGLQVVASLSSTWGWEPLSCGGKVVWVVFCAQQLPDPRAGAGPGVACAPPGATIP